MMEELDVKKTRKPKMWLRRGLVLSLMLGLAIVLFNVLSIWSAGRLVLLTAGLAVFAVLSIIGIPGSAGVGFLVGCFLTDWADLADWVSSVFGVLTFVAYVIGYTLLFIFVLPGWGDALRFWVTAGVH